MAAHRSAPPTNAAGGTLSMAGWATFALGVVVTGIERGSLIGGSAACVSLVGALLVVVGRFWRDQHARREALPVRPAPWSVPLGISLLVFGAVALLYPAFVTRSEFRQLVEAFPYGPMVAVAFGFCGIAFLIDGLDRAAPDEPPFALETSWREELTLLFTKPHRFFLRFFPETWTELDAEAARAREGKSGYEWRPIVVFCTGAVFLSLMEYFGHAPTFREIIEYFDPVGRMGPPETFWAVLRDSPFRRLLDFVWWSGWRVLGFFVLPALVVKLILRQKIADHGLHTRGFLKHSWIYVTAFLIVLGLVGIVSAEQSFKTYYPFYNDASRSWYDFWAWEALYAAQFFSLEFFFRGFWLKAGKRGMGSHAIYAMVVPYCMIHFGKPFPETLAAIIAGVFLGTLALRTRSIWSGFLIHVGVAISMDMAALMRTTGLPDRWWPDL